MSIITQSQRYLPHELKTRFYACELYRNTGCPIEFVTRRYHISKASLMRWNKRYDGTNKVIGPIRLIQAVIPKKNSPGSEIIFDAALI